MTLAHGYLSLFFTISLSAATIPIAPRDVVGDVFTSHSRPNLSAATNGNTFIVAWQDNVIPINDSTARVYVRTYDASGMPEQTLPVPINAYIGPAVVWSGTDWIVGSDGYTSRFSFPSANLYATRVSEHATESGDPTQLASTALATGGIVGAVAHDNDLFIGDFGNTVVTGPELQIRHKLDTHVRPLAAADGTFLAQGSGNAVIVSHDGTVLQNIATSGVMSGAADDNRYAIVYAANNAIEALFVDPDGTIAGHATLQTNADARMVTVTRRGNSYLAGWYTGQQNLCFENFDALSKGAAQCRAMPHLESFALADNGTRTMLAYSAAEPSFQRDHVYTTFFSSASLPQFEQQVEATTMLRPQLQPQLALDGNGLLAAWTDGHAVFLGGPGRSSGAIATGQGRVDNLRLSRSRSATLVLWSDQEPSALLPVVQAVFIPDHGPERFFTLGNASTFEVASDGDVWLVVAQEFIDNRQKMRASVIANGTVIASELQLAASDFSQYNIAVASRGSDFLVAWTEDHPYPDGERLLALGVSAAGTPNGSVMDLAGGPIQRVAMAASGRFYLIVVQAPNIGFPVTSTVPDILVAGVPESAPIRVQPRDGGFAVLYGVPARAKYVDAFGNDAGEGVLPFVNLWPFDFLYDGPRLVFAHTVYDSWSSQVLLELYDPRVRALKR